MPQICDMGQTGLLPLRRKACCGFFRPKNPTASAGFEPAMSGTRGQHANPLCVMITQTRPAEFHFSDSSLNGLSCGSPFV
jgi:hypothetical protein